MLSFSCTPEFIHPLLCCFTSRCLWNPAGSLPRTVLIRSLCMKLAELHPHQDLARSETREGSSPQIPASCCLCVCVYVCIYIYIYIYIAGSAPCSGGWGLPAHPPIISFWTLERRRSRARKDPIFHLSREHAPTHAHLLSLSRRKYVAQCITIKTWMRKYQHICRSIAYETSCCLHK